jgi:hypothetical protein
MLKPETSIMVGLATAGAVAAIYSNALPPITDIRLAEAGDPDVSGSERGAAVLSAVVVAGIAFISKDPTVLVIGGATMLGLSWFHRHANEVNPMTGRVATMGGEAAQYSPDDDSLAA